METYTWGHFNGFRGRYVKAGSKLQIKGTKSAKRLLKKMSGREHRFVSDVSHIISKRIVAPAKDT